MKKLVVFIILLALFTVSGMVLAGKPVHQASGGGTVDWFNGRVTYGFVAQIDADGNVKGQATFHHRDTGDLITHVAVTCLAVSGNDAWIGGIVTFSNGFPNVGDEMIWHVQDNGQGQDAPPDRISSANYFANADNCYNMPFTNLIDWTNGNVNVR